MGIQLNKYNEIKKGNAVIQNLNERSVGYMSHFQSEFKDQLDSFQNLPAVNERKSVDARSWLSAARKEAAEVVVRDEEINLIAKRLTAEFWSTTPEQVDSAWGTERLHVTEETAVSVRLQSHSEEAVSTYKSCTSGWDILQAAQAAPQWLEEVAIAEPTEFAVSDDDWTNNLDDSNFESSISEPMFPSLINIENDHAIMSMEPLLDADEIEAGLTRTARGTIDFVWHANGRKIKPLYNNCGMLNAVRFSDGIDIRTAGRNLWILREKDGYEVTLTALFFDRKGNLTCVSDYGQRVTYCLDGSTRSN